MFPYGSSVAWKRKGNNVLFYYVALGVVSLFLLLLFQSGLTLSDKLLLGGTLTIGIIKASYYYSLRKKSYIQFHEDRLEIAQIPLLKSKQINYNQIHNVVMVNNDMLTLNMVDGSEETIYRDKLTDVSFNRVKGILVDQLGPRSAYF
ncbi:hypothetical protein N780_04160 [Pontibacillus chungwhensis BH030062]|uniref:DUF304 domain-containing protein n=1 Tax=Pontibacillus chungwhensis BH030062 TaxID=1385513 RepID=A0A0A2UVX0_9BACI|nr:hypothetical protein [Pontibacillus chungwhensis]KGP90661.1 hypothetical protein N780_04160 [Pontibacillus chungwhensis BH030062]